MPREALLPVPGGTARAGGALLPVLPRVEERLARDGVVEGRVASTLLLVAQKGRPAARNAPTRLSRAAPHAAHARGSVVA